MSSALTFPGAAGPGAKAVQYAVSPMRVVKVLCTFGGTYSTGGEAFDPAAANAGLVPSNAAIQWVEYGDTGINSLGYSFVWDKTNKKILAFNGITELAGASGALAGKTVVVLLYIQ